MSASPTTGPVPGPVRAGAGERARLAALHAHGALEVLAPPGDPGVAADPELDAVVRLAAALTGAPTAAVDLLDAHRQVRLAAHGAATGCTDRRESLCAAALDASGAPGSPDVVVVRDARRDPRHRASAWVDGRLGDVVFHACAPLLTPEGHRLGSLCVADAAPRDLTAEQAGHLRDLAGLVVALLERHRRRQVALLAEVERLRRANDELTHLAAAVGHDLATPLTAVTGYLDLVLDVHGDDLGAQGGAWLGTALRAAHRMQGLVEAVLSPARPGTGTCTPRPVDVRDVLRHVVEDLGPACAGARITCTEVPAEPGGTLDAHADPVLLHRLLQNLLANALRHRDPARPCRVDVTAAALPGGGWELTVADNGRGIPADRREAVFAMFTTGTADTDADAGTDGDGGPGGHGIGLATCRGIATRHGGRIHAEQTPGGGATLRATFPRVPTTAPTAGVA